MIAVVTGAGRGIGLSIAAALAAEGYTVVAAARTITDQLARLPVQTYKADLATSEGPGQLIADVLTEHGAVDLLVNNVGGSTDPSGGFLQLDDHAWTQTFDLTFMSAVRATRAALPSLLERRGTVINISSVNARLALPHLVAYSAAKAALTNLGKSLAEEFGAQGLRVNTISPGPVWTDVWTGPGGPGESLATAAGSTVEAFRDHLPAATGVSTGRFAEPEEIAALVCFLASGKVANMSGSDIVIDGGMIKTA